MVTEVLLMTAVQDLGEEGDVVKVNDGYARNYLLPRKLAAAVTPVAIRRLEARKLQMQKEHEERKAVAQAMADKIASLSVTLTAEAGENDKLYGSVSAVQIGEALATQGLDVDRQAILLEEHIKELGVYTVNIRLHDEVQAALKVWVVRA